MYLVDKVIDWFKKGGTALVGDSLETIFDHPEIDFSKDEYARIADSLRMFRGKYKQLEYNNSKGRKTKRDFYDLNMLKEVVHHMAQLLYNENCNVSVEGKAEELVADVLTRTQFNKNFSGYLEPMLALGGLVAKPYYDAGTGQIEISWALADAFIPLQSNTNDISEGVFTSSTQKTVNETKYYYTLMEFHKWQDGLYTITNELYRSKKEDKVGKRVPLAELYEGLAEKTEYMQFTRPNFVYLKPNNFNNINPESPLGLGVCDNAKNTLKFINETYDGFHWEVKQGKRRVIVSDHFIKQNIDPETGRAREYFDDDTDVYLAIRGDMDSMKFENITQPIRSGDYIQAINKNLATLEMQVGLSAGTFSFDAEGVKTATEVVSRDSTSYRTRSSHLNNVESFIKELIKAICELARETYDFNGQALYSGEVPADDQIAIDFDDGVFTSREQELDFLTRADALGTIPLVKKIAKTWNITEEEAEKWAAQIRAEQAKPAVGSDDVFNKVFGEYE